MAAGGPFFKTKNKTDKQKIIRDIRERQRIKEKDMYAVRKRESDR